jgi:uncharacterized RDD family membrane protein YckC
MLLFQNMALSASLLLRTVAKSIDFIIIFAAAEALPNAGWLAGLGYLLISDGLFDGRSIGKRLTGLKVVTASGASCTIKDSILRNSILAGGLFLWRVPLLGWLLLLAVVAFEFVVLLGSKEGLRLGDEIAGTSVLEISESKEEK